MTKDEALKLALEALETLHDENMDYLTRNKLGGENNQCLVFAREAITAIKEALEQPEQEPVAWISTTELLVMRGNAYAGAKDWRVNLGLEPEEGDVGLYTTPPQHTWVGLTDEDELDWDGGDLKSLVKAIEARLKEKNNA